MAEENKLVMPKGDGTLEAINYSLQVYYKYKDTWVSNEIFKEEIHKKFRFNEEKDGPFLIKKSEIAKYFGMINYNTKKREGRITDRGKKYHLSENIDQKIDLIFEAISNDTFGRNNCVVPSSTSKVDPPKLLIKSIYELSYVTKEEFAYILYYAHNLNWNFNDIITEIYSLRQGKYAKQNVSKENINKYNDVKFIVFFTNLGVINYENKQYSFNQNIYNRYHSLIEHIDIYNVSNIEIHPVYINEDDEEYSIDSNIEEENTYIIDGKALEVQNNRQPELVSYSSSKPKYRVNNRIKKTAIEISEYKCNISSEHITFKNKKDKHYMEGHHFIPMSAQGDFENINLDRVENIATLCPNCHRAIHYGNDEERFSVLKKLYEIKINNLKEVGIDISLENLFNRYYK
ncbi:MAG: HNH endonuclease signature motif containing protein [Romboutsia sp.]